jgi:hypothetical protein
MAIDAALGRLGIKSGVCTSSTRPTNPYSGQLIYETDTNRTLVYDNAAWLVVADNQVLSIDSTNGYVGINTNTPTNTLDVDGGANIQGTALIRNMSVLNQAYGPAEVLGDFSIGNTGSEAMYVDASAGRVGINDISPSYALDVNGDINATGNLRIGGTAIGTWTSYTPTLTASVTNPTLGTGGSTYGLYTQINDLVVGTAYVAFGSSGASGGSGTLRVSAPVEIDTSDVSIITGFTMLYDASGTYFRTAAATWSTSTTFSFYTGNDSPSLVTSGTPFGWTSFDQIRVHFRYKAA